MDALEESLEDYLLKNFEQLSPDIIRVILGQLDPKTVVLLCQTSKKFYEACKRIGTPNKKAVEFVAREAPLSSPVRTPLENAELIRRGFKSIYAVSYGDEDEELFVPSNNVKFGIPSKGLEFGVEILGLPPLKGTRVWIIVDTNWDDGAPIAQVYSSREELIHAWNNGKEKYTRRNREFFGDDHETNENPLRVLLRGGMVLGVIIREVELP